MKGCCVFSDGFHEPVTRCSCVLVCCELLVRGQKRLQVIVKRMHGIKKCLLKNLVAGCLPYLPITYGVPICRSSRRLSQTFFLFFCFSNVVCASSLLPTATPTKFCAILGVGQLGCERTIFSEMGSDYSSSSGFRNNPTAPRQFCRKNQNKYFNEAVSATTTGPATTPATANHNCNRNNTRIHQNYRRCVGLRPLFFADDPCCTTLSTVARGLSRQPGFRSGPTFCGRLLPRRS